MHVCHVIRLAQAGVEGGAAAGADAAAGVAAEARAAVRGAAATARPALPAGRAGQQRHLALAHVSQMMPQTARPAAAPQLL
jgi:hypothetical protein